MQLIRPLLGSTKPARDAALGLGRLLLDCLVKLVDLLVRFAAGGIQIGTCIGLELGCLLGRIGPGFTYLRLNFSALLACLLDLPRDNPLAMVTADIDCSDKPFRRTSGPLCAPTPRPPSWPPLRSPAVLT